MDWLEFISNIFSSITWPLIILIIVIIFKRELGSVMKRVSNVKYKDLDIAFKNIKKQAQVILPNTQKRNHVDFVPPQKNNVIDSLKDQVLNAAELSPLASILLAWSGLEVAIADAVARLAISPDSPSYRSTMHNIDMLSKYTDISPDLISLINKLRKLRNEVAHANVDFSVIASAQVENYVKVTYDIIENLENIKLTKPTEK